MWVCFYLCWRERRGWEGGGGCRFRGFFEKCALPTFWVKIPIMWRKKNLIYITGIKNNGHNTLDRTEEKKRSCQTRKKGKNTKKIKNAYNTWCSQAVTHLSTNHARRCLTSVIGREPVFSTWYGRRHSTTVGSLYKLILILLGKK